MSQKIITDGKKLKGAAMPRILKDFQSAVGRTELIDVEGDRESRLIARKALEEQVKSAAKNDLHKQLLTAVTRIAEGLDKEDISKLHNTTFSNLQELLAKVPDLNITNDPMLEELRKQAEASLNYQMDQVKKSAVLKEQAQEAAKAILATYGGGVRRISMTPSAPSPQSSAA